MKILDTNVLDNFLIIRTDAHRSVHAFIYIQSHKLFSVASQLEHEL